MWNPRHAPVGVFRPVARSPIDPFARRPLHGLFPRSEWCSYAEPGVRPVRPAPATSFSLRPQRPSNARYPTAVFHYAGAQTIPGGISAGPRTGLRPFAQPLQEPGYRARALLSSGPGAHHRAGGHRDPGGLGGAFPGDSAGCILAYQPARVRLAPAEQSSFLPAGYRAGAGMQCRRKAEPARLSPLLWPGPPPFGPKRNHGGSSPGEPANPRG